MVINTVKLHARHVHLSHPKYRPDIDGLRALAILSVVGFHAFPTLFPGGFIGVDIFFVISGFLISTIIYGSLERNSFSFAEFYARRIKRIFPALILVLIACFIFGWFTLLTDEYGQLGKHIAGGAGFISNFILWNESGYFDSAAETKLLLHLWSLGVEEQYYFIWPLLLWFAWKRNVNLLAVAIAIGMLSFALNFLEAQPVADFYSPQTRFWELMLGSVLAYMKQHKQNIYVLPTRRVGWIVQIFKVQMGKELLSNWQAVSGALLIATGFLVITKGSHFPGWLALFPTIGSMLIISAGERAWFNRIVLSSRILIWFGLISFPLYLWHWPILSYLRILESATPSIEMRLGAVIVAITLAWATYRYVEQPIRAKKHSQVTTASLVVLMLVVGLVGFNCYQRDGLSFRLQKLGFRLPENFQTLAWTEQKGQEVSKEIRVGSCLLNPEQDAEAFRACDTLPEVLNKPSILLWGDSYAAHLYPGYQSIFGGQYKIIQRTASACPPILNLEIEDRPKCKEINEKILQFVLNEKPARVVLAACWTAYDWRRAEETISQLRKIGIKNIDVIGSVPQWNDSLYKQLYLKYRLDGQQELPTRMKFGLKEGFIKLEPQISKYFSELGVNYISSKEIMCNDLGCLTRIGVNGGTLTTYDGAHLTILASQYLVSQFPKF